MIENVRAGREHRSQFQFCLMSFRSFSTVFNSGALTFSLRKFGARSLQLSVCFEIRIW